MNGLRRVVDYFTGCSQHGVVEVPEKAWVGIRRCVLRSGHTGAHRFAPEPSPETSADDHVLPAPPRHWTTMDGWCWCQPVSEERPDGSVIYIHRRLMDGPAIEPTGTEATDAREG